MINIIFEFGMENVEVKVDGGSVLFRTKQTQQYATIEGLRLSHSGVLKEFPDLAGKENWKEEAIKRFKENISQMRTEIDIAEYLMDDLKKFGYKPLYWQKAGHRPIKLK